MNAQAVGSVLLLAFVLVTDASARADDNGSAPPTQPKTPQTADRRSTQIELQIEFVTPLSRYFGQALVAAVDPRFVLGGKVVWVQHPELMALHSRQAFAIHSPSRLGIRGRERGATICLLLTRNMVNEKKHWELSATKPDAGCRGGG